jgi:hypothetical protein
MTEQVIHIQTKIIGEQQSQKLGDYETDMAQRQCLLNWIDILERKWGISPRTAEIRKINKKGGENIKRLDNVE